jgi:hypothetical protein
MGGSLVGDITGELCDRQRRYRIITVEAETVKEGQHQRQRDQSRKQAAPAARRGLAGRKIRCGEVGVHPR